MKDPIELTPEAVRGAIFSPRNRRWKVWTATVLLARFGERVAFAKGEQFDRSKPLRRRAARILRQLWERGILYRQETMHTWGGLAEIKYIRPEDANGTYLIACAECRGPRRSAMHFEGRRLGVCPRCGFAGPAGLASRDPDP